MRKFDLVIMCLKNLFRRKVRTFLTIIGVIVGTCAIVVMISIGIGMRESQKKLLSEMGDLSIIDIYNWNSSSNGKKSVLDDETMGKILSFDGVLTGTPFYRSENMNAKLVAGRNDRYSANLYNLIGVYPEALQYLGYNFLDGDSTNPFPSEYSIIIGEKFAYRFRDTRKKNGKNRVDSYPNARGEIDPPFVDLKEEKATIQLQKENNSEEQQSGRKKGEHVVDISGRLKEDWNLGYETSQGAFISIETLKKLESEYKKMNKIKVNRKDVKGYDEAKIKVTDIKYVADVEEKIKDLGFETNSMESIRKPMEENVNKQQTFLGVIAGVSLFVAALGIANTMLMSIYERTREIGIMKVVGCYVKDIRTIFLMEAGCIGFIGGIAGVILSYIISFLMNYFNFSTGMGGNFFGETATGTQVSIIPIWLVLGALAFSTIIGVVSGYYPANRAVKISALTAIKQD